MFIWKTQFNDQKVPEKVGRLFFGTGGDRENQLRGLWSGTTDTVRFVRLGLSVPDFIDWLGRLLIFHFTFWFGGKIVLQILDSAKHGRWLSEEKYLLSRFNPSEVPTLNFLRWKSAIKFRFTLNSNFFHSNFQFSAKNSPCLNVAWFT